MTIFLTGGTGYVGAPVLRLLAASHRVTALVRGEQQAAAVAAIGAEPLIGDLARPHEWTETARAADAIVHAGIASGPDRIDIDRAVVEALRDSPRFIYTSVLFVLGNVEGGTEESAVNPPPYAKPRAEHEELVVAAGGTVIRPGMVYGGAAGGALNEMIASGAYVGDGENRWSLIHREDVATLFARVVESNARGIFHAVDGAPMRVADIARVAGAGRAIPLDEARGFLGGFADALCLDQAVFAPRAATLGWKPRLQRLDNRLLRL